MLKSPCMVAGHLATDPPWIVRVPDLKHSHAWPQHHPRESLFRLGTPTKAIHKKGNDVASWLMLLMVIFESPEARIF